MTPSLAVILAGLLPMFPQDHEHGGSKPEEGLKLPMTRDASGTAWQPDSTPMRAYHFVEDAWMLMLHGNVHIGYDFQSTRRGDDQWLSTN